MSSPISTESVRFVTETNQVTMHPPPLPARANRSCPKFPVVATIGCVALMALGIGLIYLNVGTIQKENHYWKVIKNQLENVPPVNFTTQQRHDDDCVKIFEKWPGHTKQLPCRTPYSPDRKRYEDAFAITFFCFMGLVVSMVGYKIVGSYEDTY